MTNVLIKSPREQRLCPPSGKEHGNEEQGHLRVAASCPLQVPILNSSTSHSQVVVQARKKHVPGGMIGTFLRPGGSAL